MTMAIVESGTAGESGTVQGLEILHESESTRPADLLDEGCCGEIHRGRLLRFPEYRVIEVDIEN